MSSKRQVSLRCDSESITHLYADDIHQQLVGLDAEVLVQRASHVEWQDGGWYADMRPSGFDARLGPFSSRETALAEESAFLLEHLIKR